MSRSYPRSIKGECGQSLVELALALPLLLISVLGVVDAGRAFYYTSVIANAARAGAAYAAAHSDATTTTVSAKVCNETGFAPYSSTPVCADLVTSATFGPGQDAVVTVTYSFRPITAYIANRLFPISPLPLRASATYPSLQ